jgi:hypothetical protein
VLTAVMVGASLAVPVSSRAAVPDPSCSWSAKTEPDTVNAAFPDTNASYWSHHYQAVPGTELLISGTFARARYFSFNIYQPTGVPVDSIYDAQIKPDPGSANPFAGGDPAAKNQRYQVRVLFTAKPARPAPNTIYAGQMALAQQQNPGGILMLRVYTPVDPSSPQGGVALPSVTTRTSSGQSITAGAPCSNDLPSTGGRATTTLNESSWPATAPTTAGTVPSWSRAFGNGAAGFFGNQQNAYLSAGINRAYGSLVVIRAKAPAFPNTSRGQWPSGRDQLRYWSICQNSDSTRVNACVADYQAAIDKKGYFVFVVSDPSQRPSNATRANGATWIPWGAGDANGLLIYRHMAPARSFRQAIQTIQKSDDPQKVMGRYYPEAHYCSRETFEQHGWRGCFG